MKQRLVCIYSVGLLCHTSSAPAYSEWFEGAAIWRLLFAAWLSDG
jgi:hypothetical protein